MTDQIEKVFGRTLTEDFETIYLASHTDLNCLVNSNIVITGASGFIGKWLTFSLLYARQKLDGKGKILLNSRNLTGLSKLCKSFEAGREITYLESDIRTIAIPKTFNPDFWFMLQHQQALNLTKTTLRKCCQQSSTVKNKFYNKG